MDNQRPRLPNFYITPSNYNELVGGGMWKINDVPLDRLAQVKDHFGMPETVAVFASGLAPRALTGGGTDSAGIDWAKLETNRKPDEPPLNVYHYRIGTPDAQGYPVFGPYINGSIAPHWATLDDLDVYLDQRNPATSGPTTGGGSGVEGGPASAKRLP
jgi:hypothetical protein